MSKTRDVFAIVVRRGPHAAEETPLKIGAAIEEDNGDLRIILDVLPFSGRLIVRERPPVVRADPRDPDNFQ